MLSPGEDWIASTGSGSTLLDPGASVFSDPTTTVTTAISGTAAAQAKSRALPTVSTTQAAHATAQAKGHALPSLTVHLSGHATAQAKAHAQIAGTGVLHARATAQAKAHGATSQSLALHARATAQAKAKPNALYQVLPVGNATAQAKATGVVVLYPPPGPPCQQPWPAGTVVWLSQGLICWDSNAPQPVSSGCQMGMTLTATAPDFEIVSATILAQQYSLRT